MRLVKTLGESFTVWENEAEIDFRNPGESTTRSSEVDLADDEATVHATVENRVYVRRDDQ